VKGLNYTNSAKGASLIHKPGHIMPHKDYQRYKVIQSHE